MCVLKMGVALEVCVYGRWVSIRGVYIENGCGTSVDVENGCDTRGVCVLRMGVAVNS